MRYVIKLAAMIAAALMVAACTARLIHVGEMKDSNCGYPMKK